MKSTDSEKREEEGITSNARISWGIREEVECRTPERFEGLAGRQGAKKQEGHDGGYSSYMQSRKR